MNTHSLVYIYCLLNPNSYSFNKFNRTNYMVTKDISRYFRNEIVAMSFRILKKVNEKRKPRAFVVYVLQLPVEVQLLLLLSIDTSFYLSLFNSLKLFFFGKFHSNYQCIVGWMKMMVYCHRTLSM